MENKKESIAQRLRKAREMAGLTQSQIAKILGLHRPSISEIEAGRRSVTTDELLIFSETYSVDLSRYRNITYGEAILLVILFNNLFSRF